MAQESVLLPRLIGLLCTLAVQRINVRLGPCTVRGADYAAIALALQYGKVGIAINPVRLKQLNADAEYYHVSKDRHFNFLSAGFGLTLVDQMDVIHECTHAVNDMHGFRWGATTTADEATAFVAGALYCYYAAVSLDPIFAITTEPFKTAFDIAQKLYSSGNPVVSVQDEFLLRKKITANPTYAGLGITLGTLEGHSDPW